MQDENALITYLRGKVAELEGVAQARLETILNLQEDNQNLVARLNEADDTISYLEQELETAREESQD